MTPPYRLHWNQVRRIKELRNDWTPRNIAAILDLPYESVRAVTDREAIKEYQAMMRART